MIQQETIQLTRAKCEQCGYKWLPKVTQPKQCPKCKRMDWDKKKKV